MLVDFEFEVRPGERPVPVCLVAKELRCGRVFRVFENEFGTALPPYATGPDVLFVAYYASAELGCYRALGWPMPERILDLFAEFRDRTNGLPMPAGSGITGCAGLFRARWPDGDREEGNSDRDRDRHLARPISPEEILNYCETRRGRAGAAAAGDGAGDRLAAGPVARSLYGRRLGDEFNGVPIDVPTLARLREGWTGIQDRLITAIDATIACMTAAVSSRPFVPLLHRHGIPWPLLESGRLDLSDDTFRQMAKAYPAISPLRELRSSLVRSAPQRSRRRPRRSQSHHAVGVPRPDWAQSTEQHEVHLRTERLASRLNQTTTWSWHRVHRLVPTGICDCRILQRRRQHDRGLSSPVTVTWRLENRQG